jgi:hypothetical protein
MAIDTATKRRAALGRSTVMLPAPTGVIGTDQRAILLRLYLLYVVATIATPLQRIYAIARELRVLSIGR